MLSHLYEAEDEEMSDACSARRVPEAVFAENYRTLKVSPFTPPIRNWDIHRRSEIVIFTHRTVSHDNETIIVLSHNFVGRDGRTFNSIKHHLAISTTFKGVYARRRA